jgi:hypothetical protein
MLARRIARPLASAANCAFEAFEGGLLDIIYNIVIDFIFKS